MYFIERFYFDNKTSQWKTQRLLEWGKFRSRDLCEGRRMKLFHQGYMKEEGPFSQYIVKFDETVN